MTLGPLCFNELMFGSPFEFVGLATVLVSSENNGFNGLCNVTPLCYFQLPGFGPIQRVHGMSPHEAHRSFWLSNSFAPFSSVSVFSMENFAVVLCNSITLLQFLDPRASGVYRPG